MSSHFRTIFSILICTSLLAAACSDDDGPTPKDTSVVEDSGVDGMAGDLGGDDLDAADSSQADSGSQPRLCLAPVPPAQCTTDGDCTPGAGNTGMCDANGQCRKCTTNLDCTTALLGIFCDPAKNACVDCLSDGDCNKGSGDTGACGADGECGKCTTTQDCLDADIAEMCDTTTNRCVHCLSDADCTKGTGNTGICDGNGCLGCDSQADCDDAFGSGGPIQCLPQP